MQTKAKNTCGFRRCRPDSEPGKTAGCNTRGGRPRDGANCRSQASDIKGFALRLAFLPRQRRARALEQGIEHRPDDRVWRRDEAPGAKLPALLVAVAFSPSGRFDHLPDGFNQSDS